MSNNYELSQAMSSVIELFAITEKQTSFPIIFVFSIDLNGNLLT